MCGVLFSISDVYNFENNFQSALAETDHRGPDNSGFINLVYNNFKIFIGSNRLNIIDNDQKSNMPFVSDCGNIILIFNGEIYNFLKLKKDLEFNHNINFSTISDTEVIIYLYKIYKESLFEKLDGMFSIIIYDKNLNKIIVSRDHIGEKPLYYYENGNTLIFCSEIKPIIYLLKKNNIQFNLCRLSITSYLLYGHNFERNNLFTKIKSFKPAYFLSINIDKNLNKYFQNYWPYKNDIDLKKLNNNDLVDNLDDILKQDLSKRVNSNFPVSLFFSGGLDSSLILEYLNQLNLDNISLVTIRSKSKETQNESEYFFQDLLLSKNRDRPVYINYYEDYNIKEEFTKFVDKIDIPQTDTATFPLYLLSKFAKSHNIRVGLTGDGSDELFGGYQKFNYLQLINKLPFRYFLKFFGKSKSLSIINQNILLQSLLLGTGSLNINKIKSILNEQDISKVLSKNLEMINKLCKENNVTNFEEKLLFIEQKILLPEYYFMKTDRASMYSSFELRSLYTSKELYEFANSINVTNKFSLSKNKIILKKLSERYFNHNFVYRKKRGFVEDLEKYINSELSEEIKDTIINNKEIFNVNDFVFNNLNYLEKYKLYILNKWYENIAKI